MKLKNIFTAFFKKFYKCLYFSWKTGGKKKGSLINRQTPWIAIMTAVTWPGWSWEWIQSISHIWVAGEKTSRNRQLHPVVFNTIKRSQKQSRTQTHTLLCLSEEANDFWFLLIYFIYSHRKRHKETDPERGMFHDCFIHQMTSNTRAAPVLSQGSGLAPESSTCIPGTQVLEPQTAFIQSLKGRKPDLKCRSWVSEFLNPTGNLNKHPTPETFHFHSCPRLNEEFN